ncbi:retrovirus-related pol polyprotein from transposon TNT 1-94 [Tanacetum coccineum]
MTRNLKLLINFVWKFMGIVYFGDDHVTTFLGYNYLQWGNILITCVYFVEGLGQNIFSVGKFCDLNLEVAFRRNTCFVKNLDGVDLLKGNCSTNLYTINLYEMTSESPVCPMARATSIKSWLWHQRLSYLNFDTINTPGKDNLITCLLKFKYSKDHICPSCEPMRVESINGKRYVLVIMDDYSRYTWVHFLRSKDEAPKVIIKFLKQIQVLLQAPVIIDIGKLGVKGDIGFFISYSTTSCAYGVYNRRTKKVIETMHVTFNELLAMAFEQSSSKLELQGMTSGHISSGLDLTYTLSTITSQKPTKRDWNYCSKQCMIIIKGGQPSEATRTAPVAPATLNLQTPNASTTTTDNTPTPTKSSTKALTIPNTSHDVDEL